MSGRTGLDFGVLGPLEVRIEGRAVQVRGVRQRALLAALLLRRGAAVPFPVLLDEVFGQAPLDDARNALQTSVARLRSALGPAAAAVVTRAPGYLLDVPAERVDAERFAALLARARQAAAPGDALGMLDQALALYRGPAYAEFGTETARAEARRLDHLRLTALEDRASLLVGLGRAGEAAGVLDGLVAAEPWRERAVDLLVTALASAGRTADALGVYSRYRERLRDELGLDPRPELRHTHERVLRGEFGPGRPR